MLQLSFLVNLFSILCVNYSKICCKVFKILFRVDVYGGHDWIVDHLELVQTDLFLNLWNSSIKSIAKSVQDIETMFQFLTEKHIET